MAELLSLKWNNHVTSFLRILKLLRNEDNYADVTLTCDGKFYDVHKLVLSMCSDYFKEIFQRSSPQTQVFIVLKDIKCEDLEFLLDYMYLGEISVRQEQLQSLIKAAECLKIKGLAVPEDESILSSSNLTVPKKTIASANLPELIKRIPNGGENILNKLLSPLNAHSRQFNDSSHQSNSPISNIIPKDEPIAKEELENSTGKLEECSLLENLPTQFPCDASLDFGSDEHCFDEEKNIYSPSSYYSQNSTIVKNWHRNSTEDSLIEDSFDLSQNKDPPFPNERVAPKKFLSTKHQCSYCGKYFPSNAHLTRHIRIHTGEKPFSCPVCNYKANQKNSVAKHVKMRHFTFDQRE